MNEAQSANRFRLAIILVVTCAIALGSFWLLEVTRKNVNGSMQDKQRTDPDYYVEKFNFVRLSPTGQLKYKIVGEKLLHFPKDDSYEIEHPIVHSLAQNQPPVTAHADTAKVEDKRKKIHLIGNVNVVRPASETRERLHLVTERLLALPDDDIMKTDQPVHITLGQSTLSGIGMIANNTTQQLQLLSKVRGFFPAQTR